MTYAGPAEMPPMPIWPIGIEGCPGVNPGGGGGCIYIGPPHKFFAQNDLMPYMQSNGELG